MEFTCCVCEHKYTEMTGDADERMCHECMYDPPDEAAELVDRKPIDVLDDGLIAMGLSNSQQAQILKLIGQYVKAV